GPGPSTVLFDPTDGDVCYAMIPLHNDSEAAVFKSTDAGMTWSAVFSAAYIGGAFSTIAVRPSSPTTLYALIDTGFGAVLSKTVDGGASWTPAPGGYLKNAVVCTDGVYVCAGGKPVIAVHPTNPNLVVVAYQEYINRSFDGGVTWTTINRDSQL